MARRLRWTRRRTAFLAAVALIAAASAAVAWPDGDAAPPTDVASGGVGSGDGGTPGGDEGPTTTSIADETTTSLLPTTETTAITATTSTTRTGGTSPSTTAAPATTTTTAKPDRPAPEICAATTAPPLTGSIFGLSGADGLEERTPGGPRRTLGRGQSFYALWSPNGRFVATNEDWSLVVHDVARSCSRTLVKVPANSGVDAVAWSPDSSELAYRTSGLYATEQATRIVRADGTGNRLLGGERTISVAWATDGSGRMAFTDEKGMWVRSANGKDTLIHATDKMAEFPEWSPDGRTIAFSMSLDSGVWVIPSAGGAARKLVQDSWQVFWSHWSPDGSTLAYAKDNSIWLVGADGSNPHAIVDTGGLTYKLHWSPDGTEIAWCLDMYGETSRVWTVRPDGTGRTDRGPGRLFGWFERTA